MNKKLLVFALILTGSLSSKAQTYSTSTVVAIPDGPGPCGTDGTLGVSTITVPLTGTIGTPSDVTINLNMDHTFVGDIAVEIIAPDLSSCFLFNHLGATTCSGSGVTLDAGNTLSFNSAYTTTISTAASPIASGNYAPTGSIGYPSACDLSTFLTGKSVNGDWSIRGIDNFGGETGNIDAWSIVFGSTALPLQLLSFSGNTHKGYNTLQWQTGVEDGTASIALERSSDGRVYNKVTAITAKGSNSSYSYDDAYLLDGSSSVLYRLKLIDKDGKYSYSNTVRLYSSTVSGQSIDINPNPAKSMINLSIGDKSLVGSQARLINHMGVTLQIIDIKSTVQSIDLSQYPAAIYMISLINGETIRFTKQD